MSPVASPPPPSAFKTASPTYPNQPATPLPPLPAPTPSSLQREYVAGGYFPWYRDAARTLSWAIDDITADFGDDVYERMLKDPQIAACVVVMKAAILENGLTLTSAIRDASEDGFDLAKEIADEATDMLSDTETPIDDILWSLLDCLPYGNKVGECVYGYEPAKKDGRPLLRLNDIVPRPRHSTAFVVDAYMKLVGLLAVVPGMTVSVGGLVTIGPGLANTPPNLLSPRKFAIATFRPVDRDPRGTSLIRPAYDPWWRKRQIIPEYLKYLAQFAGPSIAGFTAPEAQSIQDPADPTNVITPEQLMLAALMEFRNGTAAAFPYGSSLKEIVMQGEGAAFLKAIAHCDQQSTKAILTQELATEQSKNQARAAAEVHQDVLSTLVRQGKRHMTGMLRRQVLMNWAEWNWGKKARRLAPFLGLGDTEQKDQPNRWTAAAALNTSKYFTADQLQALDAMLGLPVRDRPEFPEPDTTADTGSDKSGDAVDQTDPAEPAAPAQPQPSAPDRVVVKPHERRLPQRKSPDPGQED